MKQKHKLIVMLLFTMIAILFCIALLSIDTFAVIDMVNGTVVDMDSMTKYERPCESFRYCSTCPSACEERVRINCMTCKPCVCPDNYGFCNVADFGRTQPQLQRTIVDGVSVYCNDGLYMEQKEDNSSCLSAYECKSEMCKEGVCFNIDKYIADTVKALTIVEEDVINISTEMDDIIVDIENNTESIKDIDELVVDMEIQIEENRNLIQKIMDWITSVFSVVF